MLKILHILTNTPTETDQILMAAWEDQGENRRFDLFPADATTDEPDYDQLVDLIFQADITITW